MKAQSRNLLHRLAAASFIAAANLFLLASPGSAEAPGPAAAPALAVQEHEMGGVDVAITELKRTSGDTLTMKWEFRNKTQEKKILATGGGFSAPYRLAKEAFLLDMKNRKRYLVVENGEYYPLARKHPTTSEGSIVVEPGQTLTTWAKFPAPPAEVTAVDVQLPQVPPFDAVPIGQ
jgi:hypothetical protein